MKRVGDRLELDFEVKVVRPGATAPQTVRFAELIAGPTVVSVYMRNNTGSCDKQNRTLAEASAAIQARGFAVVAVSRDTAGSHARYAAKHGIGYTLVSDPEDRFGQASDAIVDKQMYGRTFRGPLRSAWVLDGAGVVRAVIDKVEAGNHGEQVLAVLASLENQVS